MSKPYPKNTESLVETYLGGRKMGANARKAAVGLLTTKWSESFTTKLKIRN